LRELRKRKSDMNEEIITKVFPSPRRKHLIEMDQGINSGPKHLANMAGYTGSVRNTLEQEIRGEPYALLLRDLQNTDSFLRRFGGWAEILAFMRKCASDDPLTDQVLRPILIAHASDRAPHWRSILLVIFWPGLESIANRKKHWDPDAEERWQNLIWAFLQTIFRLDPVKRQGRFVQKIINDTFNRFCGKYRCAWNRAEHELTTDPDQLADLAGGDTEIDFDGIDRSSTQATEIERLVAHMVDGRLSEEDFLLLIGTRVYGKTGAECAHEMGMDREQARKRRFRAEATLREFEKTKEP
jgi:hypothetical protein